MPQTSLIIHKAPNLERTYPKNHKPFNPLLGGPCDLVTTYNWAYDPTCTSPKWAYRVYPNYK